MSSGTAIPPSSIPPPRTRSPQTCVFLSYMDPNPSNVLLPLLDPADDAPRISASLSFEPQVPFSTHFVQRACDWMLLEGHVRQTSTPFYVLKILIHELLLVYTETHKVRSRAGARGNTDTTRCMTNDCALPHPC